MILDRAVPWSTRSLAQASLMDGFASLAPAGRHVGHEFTDLKANGKMLDGDFFVFR
jgi:hypothetical protein